MRVLGTRFRKPTGIYITETKLWALKALGLILNLSIKKT